jgi:hypothetical protein
MGMFMAGTMTTTQAVIMATLTANRTGIIGSMSSITTKSTDTTKVLYTLAMTIITKTRTGHTTRKPTIQQHTTPPHTTPHTPPLAEPEVLEEPEVQLHQQFRVEQENEGELAEVAA